MKLDEKLKKFNKSDIFMRRYSWQKSCSETLDEDEEQIYTAKLGNKSKTELKVCCIGGVVKSIISRYVARVPERRSFQDTYTFWEAGFRLDQRSKLGKHDWVTEPEQDLGDYRPPIVISELWKAAFWDLTQEIPEIRDSLLDRVNMLETPGPKFKE